MATSNAFPTDNQYIWYKFETIQNWQDTVNNYSRITIKVWCYRSNTGYTTYGTGKCWIRINGTWYGQDITPSQKITNSGIYLFERSFDVYHNSDGTLDLWVEGYIYHERFESVIHGYTVSFDTIARKSTINSISGTTIGGNMTVNLNKKASQFTTTIFIHVPGHDWYWCLWDDTGSSSITFTIPNELAKQIANATGITARVIARTWNGDTQIGDAEYSFWLQVPSWMVPSISNVQLDTDHQINGQWLWVKDKSKLRVRTTASGTYGSSITEYKVTYDGVDYWGNDIYTSIQRTSEYRNVTVTVKDSRGRTASTTKQVYVFYYQPPWGSITAYRCNEHGQRNDTEGTYVKVSFNGDKSYVNGANTFALAIDHRETGKEWSSNDVWHGSPVGYASEILGSATAQYDVDKTYEIRLKVSDWYTTTYYTVPISTANVLMDFRRGGNGVGFGMVCTQDDTVQFNREIQIFAGRGGNTGYGADLSFCNVSNESQKIGINGGTPGSDKLINIYRYTSSASGNSAHLWYIDKWNNCHHGFENNFFWRNIFFDPYSSSSENIIKSRYSNCYLYFHNPNHSNYSHGIGAYHTDVGGIWEYHNGPQQLRLKSGYGTISDERTKYDFNEFENWDDYYNFYMSLKPKTFKYITDPREETHIGMVAQEVADSIVENNLNNEKLCLVKCTPNEDMDDGREYVLAYQELISLNIKMIQKHEAEILELKSIIAQQQELIDKISGGV